MITISPVQSVLRPIFQRVINSIPGGYGFSPLSLFSSGEQGAWYDPSDLSTMFQDAEGTTPVTAAGQPVGLIRDKSGRGNHASQVTTGSKPMLRNTGALWYLEFDGVDDFLVTGNINFTATNKMSMFAGVGKLAATRGVLCELSAAVSINNGSFDVEAPPSIAGRYQASVRGTAGNVDIIATGYTEPNTAILGVAFDLTQVTAPLASIMRVNGIAATLNGGVSSPAGGVFGNYPLYLGRRGGTSLPFKGYIYGLVIRGALTDATGITIAEKFMGAKSGVTL